LWDRIDELEGEKWTCMKDIPVEKAQKVGSKRDIDIKYL